MTPKISQLPSQDLAPRLGAKHYVVFALPYSVIQTCIFVHDDGHPSKSQTSAATPAKPGELPNFLAIQFLQVVRRVHVQ
jgi:hypothetical protein